MLELLDSAERAWTGEVTTLCLDRFERRLVEETGRLRVDIANLRGETFGKLEQTDGGLRTEMAGLRVEMAQTHGALRVELVREMQIGFGAIRQEMANNRVEFLRWAFVFWVGQFFAVAGLVGVLMRTTLAR